VQEIIELMGCTLDQGITIMRHFKWNMDKLQNEWFGNERKLGRLIGIECDPELPKKFPFMNASLPTHNQGYCQICYS
jgi:hypothetical protein